MRKVPWTTAVVFFHLQNLYLYPGVLVLTAARDLRSLVLYSSSLNRLNRFFISFFFIPFNTSCLFL